ncbi:hypothetical protein P153DRAFT_28521 [Dothidotthia symphoricarpi CBS 119687]|uniref:Zn(2)-C6 fungal-type domain-containing protein n=1 Tax=Dothidotthia symphoricarpi CBS 119687 TaxID=1392245 RepID=A0A6A6ACF8_9PLEO|nr:uncharacterized protein P153DRAFT_28521 [Dothidotthia symphoricarpi CBS 119687]KAF2128923.1 hypothetical protein P153DRAFT_28521 [Dothidotthia symphoricarpi CBS 119687]
MSSMVKVPKRTRRRNPKVKTGCKTCKIRHVKCDEAKPNCLKCTSTGRKCDGYVPTSGCFQFRDWSDSQDSSPQKAMSVFTVFGDSVRYLEFYHHCARPALSTSFDREFWSRIAFQMAHAEPAVRHALTALGYLCQTEPGSLKHARSRLIADNERKVLLLHYNKSIGCLVERMAEASYSSEIGLVTCLLFICIEFLQGNYHTGFTHMRNGLKLISERRQKPQHDSPLRTTTLIEDKLVPIFIRGVTSALLYGVEAEEDLDIPLPTPSFLLPQPFTSLFEAQETCYELRNASVLHLRIVGRKLLENTQLSVQDLQNQSNLLACHHSWLQNFDLFEQNNKLSKEERVASSALKASYYSTFIYLSCSDEASETQYDAHNDQFKEIIHHARLVIDSMAPTTAYAAHYTFDISIIPQLHFVATRCRCPSTRREAVALLARNPPREGLWDSQQHVVVSRRLIEMEESQVDSVTGWPVQETRLWGCVINADMDRNGGFWTSFLPARWVGRLDQNGKPRLLEEFFVL